VSTDLDYVRSGFSSITIKAIREGLSKGIFTLPNFQRIFKWKVTDALLLFDSIEQGFPSGAFIFQRKEIFKGLESASEELHFIREVALPPDTTYRVIDGQQRLTTLNRTLCYGIGDKAIDTWPIGCEYVCKNKTTVKFKGFKAMEGGKLISETEVAGMTSYVISMRDLLDVRGYHKIARKLDNEIVLDKASELRDKFLEYTFPFFIVKIDRDEEYLKELFKRFNRAGKRLTVLEAFNSSATDWNLKILDIIKDELGWGKLGKNDAMNIFFALRKEPPTETSKVGSLSEYTTIPVDEITAVLRDSFEYLRTEFYVTDRVELPYIHILLAIIIWKVCGQNFTEVFSKWLWSCIFDRSILLQGSAQRILKVLSDIAKTDKAESKLQQISQEKRIYPSWEFTAFDVSCQRLNTSISKSIEIIMLKHFLELGTDSALYSFKKVDRSNGSGLGKTLANIFIYSGTLPLYGRNSVIVEVNSTTSNKELYLSEDIISKPEIPITISERMKCFEKLMLTFQRNKLREEEELDFF